MLGLFISKLPFKFGLLLIHIGTDTSTQSTTGSAANQGPTQCATAFITLITDDGPGGGTKNCADAGTFFCLLMSCIGCTSSYPDQQRNNKCQIYQFVDHFHSP